MVVDFGIVCAQHTSSFCKTSKNKKRTSKKRVWNDKTNGTNQQTNKQRQYKSNASYSMRTFIHRLIYFIQMILLFNQKHTSILPCGCRASTGLSNILLELAKTVLYAKPFGARTSFSDDFGVFFPCLVQMARNACSTWNNKE